MAEPGPQPARPVPDILGPSGEDEVGHDIYHNQTPEPELLERYPDVFGVWWSLHCFGLGSLFLVIGLYALYATVVLLRGRRGKKSTIRPFLVSINTLVAIMCFARALYLYVDPYNQTSYFPRVFNIILFNTPYPCLTSTFAMVLWVLREVGQLKLSVRSRNKNIRVLIAIIVTHFVLVIIISGIVEYTMIEVLLVTLCHGFFVVWGLFLCCGSLYLARKIIILERSTRNSLVSISAKGHSPAPLIPNKSADFQTTPNKIINESAVTDSNVKILVEDENSSVVPFHQRSSPNQEDCKGVPIFTFDDNGTKSKEPSAENPSIVKSPQLEKLVELDPKMLQSEVNPAYSCHFAETRSKRDENHLPAEDIKSAITDSSIDTATGDGSSSLILSNLMKLVQSMFTLGGCCSDRNNEVNERTPPAKEPRKRLGTDVSSQCNKRRNTRSSNPAQRPSFGDMGRRAKLTRKVIRITIVTTATNFTACILNVVFIIASIPQSNLFKNSMTGSFVFWTCFRLTEISMACVMLYFSAQPMTSMKVQHGRSTIKTFISTMRAQMSRSERVPPSVSPSSPNTSIENF